MEFIKILFSSTTIKSESNDEHDKRGLPRRRLWYESLWFWTLHEHHGEHLAECPSNPFEFLHQYCDVIIFCVHGPWAPSPTTHRTLCSHPKPFCHRPRNWTAWEDPTHPRSITLQQARRIPLPAFWSSLHPRFSPNNLCQNTPKTVP